MQVQAYNRKSFLSRADTTAIWQRTPRNARDGELEIHPDSLQTKLSDYFIPPPAKKVARKSRNPARYDSHSLILVAEVLKTFVPGHRELPKPRLPRLDGAPR